MSFLKQTAESGVTAVDIPCCSKTTSNKMMPLLNPFFHSTPADWSAGSVTYTLCPRNGQPLSKKAKIPKGLFV
jgi:hypothetical protein